MVSKGEILKILHSYKSERVSARKSMPLDTNPQPRLRNTLRDGLGGGGDIASRKCIGTFEGRDEGGSEADLRRSYRAKTAAYEPSPCGFDRALSETRSFDVKADPVYVCYGGDGSARRTEDTTWLARSGSARAVGATRAHSMRMYIACIEGRKTLGDAPTSTPYVVLWTCFWSSTSTTRWTPSRHP